MSNATSIEVLVAFLAGASPIGVFDATSVKFLVACPAGASPIGVSDATSVEFLVACPAGASPIGVAETSAKVSDATSLEGVAIVRFSDFSLAQVTDAATMGVSNAYFTAVSVAFNAVVSVASSVECLINLLHLLMPFLWNFFYTLSAGGSDAFPMVVSDTSPVSIPNTFLLQCLLLMLWALNQLRVCLVKFLKICWIFCDNHEILFTDCFMKIAL